MTPYKVFFHSGEELGLKTRVEKGTATLDESALRLEGPNGLSIPLSQINGVELFRLHGTMRVIRINHSGGRLYVSVIRFMIGQFASVNFFKTGDLYNRLVATTQTH
jgi:hypothetical protein